VSSRGPPAISLGIRPAADGRSLGEHRHMRDSVRQECELLAMRRLELSPPSAPPAPAQRGGEQRRRRCDGQIGRDRRVRRRHRGGAHARVRNGRPADRRSSLRARPGRSRIGARSEDAVRQRSQRSRWRDGGYDTGCPSEDEATSTASRSPRPASAFAICHRHLAAAQDMAAWLHRPAAALMSPRSAARPLRRAHPRHAASPERRPDHLARPPRAVTPSSGRHLIRPAFRAAQPLA
jgi:hypothetical protein